jgi:hypothetical protein
MTRTVIVMSRINSLSVFAYELIGMMFIVIVGSALHFTFDLSRQQPIVGVFSAVNESVWEHLKLAFWPVVLIMLIEYTLLKKSTNNFDLAKTVGVYLMVIIIPIVFHFYIAITGKSVLIIDISTFIVAITIGQLSSYKLLTYRKFSENLKRMSLIALTLLGLALYCSPSIHHNCQSSETQIRENMESPDNSNQLAL